MARTAKTATLALTPRYPVRQVHQRVLTLRCLVLLAIKAVAGGSRRRGCRPHGTWPYWPGWWHRPSGRPAQLAPTPQERDPQARSGLDGTRHHSHRQPDWHRRRRPYAPGIGATNYNLAGGGSVIERTPPEPTASSDDVLQWDPDTKALARTLLHHGTAQTLTWERLPVDEVLAAHGVYAAVTYKGVVASRYPATVTNGDAWFVRLGSEWIRGIGGHWVQYLPPNGLGEFSYEADAEAAVTAVGQIATFPLEHTSDHRVYPNRVTTFTAGTVTARRLQQALFATPTAAEIPLVTTAFDNNLDNTVVNVQDLAQAVDDLVVAATTPTIPRRRPTCSLHPLRQ